MLKTISNPALMLLLLALITVLQLTSTTICALTSYHVRHATMALQDYQIELNNDSVYIYRDNIFLTKCAWGKDGIDSVLLDDNR